MKKKGVVALAIVLLGAIWWWVVYGQSAGRSTEEPLKVWLTWGDGRAPIQALFDGYDRPVRVRTRVSSDKALRAMLGSRPPDLIVLSSSDPIEAYVQQGALALLSPSIEMAGIDVDDIYPAALSQCRLPSGDYVCLPWGVDLDALYWNKDLFAAAGLDPERPPQTMAALAEMAEKLTIRDESGQLTQVGFLPDFPRSHLDLYESMLSGGRLGENRTGPDIDTNAMAEALAWQDAFRDLYPPDEVEAFVSSFTPYLASRHAVFSERRLSCQQCHRAAPARKDKLPDSGFAMGRIAMMVDGQWHTGMQGFSASSPDLNYGVAPFPAPAAHPERAGAAVVHGPVIVMPAGIEDQGAAANLLAWMVSPGTSAEMAHQYGGLPASQTAGQDPRFHSNPNYALFLTLLSQLSAGHTVEDQPAVPPGVLASGE